MNSSTATTTTRMSTLQKHTWLLREAIDTAKEHVIISSPFISPVAIRYDNIPDRISRAIGRSVTVKVYVGDLFNRGGDEVKHRAKEGVQILLTQGRRCMFEGIYGHPCWQRQKDQHGRERPQAG